jgi:hypothetical protein
MDDYKTEKANLAALHLKKREIVYITLIDEPAFNNYAKKFKFAIYKAETKGFSGFRYYNLYSFKNVSKILGAQMLTYKDTTEIEVGSPRFEHEDHGRTEFIHRSLSEAKYNVIRFVFKGDTTFLRKKGLSQAGMMQALFGP